MLPRLAKMPREWPEGNERETGLHSLVGISYLSEKPDPQNSTPTLKGRPVSAQGFGMRLSKTRDASAAASLD